MANPFAGRRSIFSRAGKSRFMHMSEMKGHALAPQHEVGAR